MSTDHGATIITHAPRVEFSVRNGIRWEQDYTCQSGSVAINQYTTLIAQGYDPVRFSPPGNGGYITVTACLAYDPATGTTTRPPATWQIDDYGGDTDLFDAKYNPIARQLNATHLQVLISARKNPPREGTFPVFNTTLTTPTSNAKEQLAFAHMLWIAYQQGEKGAPQQLPILRRSYNIFDSYVITDTLGNVNDTIINTATLIRSEQVPNAYASIIAVGSTATVSNNSLKYKWGWIKRYPKINTIGENQSQVNQEWIYGLWNNSITFLKSI